MAQGAGQAEPKPWLRPGLLRVHGLVAPWPAVVRWAGPSPAAGIITWYWDSRIGF